MYNLSCVGIMLNWNEFTGAHATTQNVQATHTHIRNSSRIEILSSINTSILCHGFVMSFFLLLSAVQPIPRPRPQEHVHGVAGANSQMTFGWYRSSNISSTSVLHASRAASKPTPFSSPLPPSPPTPFAAAPPALAPAAPPPTPLRLLPF